MRANDAGVVRLRGRPTCVEGEVGSPIGLCLVEIGEAVVNPDNAGNDTYEAART